MNETNTIQQLRDFVIPKSLKFSLEDFEEQTGCACLLLFSDNTYIHSSNCVAQSLTEGFLAQSELGLFESISQQNSVRNDRCYEIEYNKNELGIFVPVFLKNELYAYFVYGQYREQQDGIFEENCKANDNCCGDSLPIKILSREQIERNIQKSVRFSELIAEQLELSYDLASEKEQKKQIYDEMRMQRSFFENLFDNSPDAIVILDNQDRVIQVNKQFEKMFEYSQAEVKGQLINELIVPNHYKEEGESATRDAAEGILVDMDTIRQVKSGKQIHVHVTGKPIMLDNNKMAVYAIYRNISDLVWNQKSEKLLSDISKILNQNLPTIQLIGEVEKQVKSIIGNGNLLFDMVSIDKRHFLHYQRGLNEFQEIDLAQSLSYTVLKDKEYLQFNNGQISSQIAQYKLRLAEEPRFWLGFPLIYQDVVLGVLGIESKEDSIILDEKVVKLFELVAHQIAIGIKEKRNRQRLNLLQRAIEQSPASVVITDLNGDIEYVNPKFTSVSGYSFSEIRGKNPRILKSGFMSKEIYDDLWQNISSGKEWSGEFLNVKKNKELYWERAVFSAIKDESGKVVQYLAVKEDVTEKKKYEKELLEAKQRAEESDRLKSAFLANMSHELRTPLNAIIGFSNLCDESLSVSEIIEFVQLINKSGNQLLGIIEDILSFTVLESEKKSIVEEEFLLSNLFREIEKKAFESRSQKNKERLELRFSPDKNYQDVLVKTDFNGLLQVVVKLLRNALKFTNEGFVEIGYFVEDGKLKIYVKDSGVGIEKTQKDIIFDKFRQVDDSITRTYGGTGMGLAISKKIMDLLGGTIEVESEVNKGSTFSLILDCVISKKKGKIDIGSQSELAEKMQSILVAEDEDSNFRLIKAILTRSNYQVCRAVNGEEAINICRENNDIELILMDLRMPGINGMKATREIRKFKPKIPIIAQTAFAMDGDKEKVLDNGFDDYISKPIKKELLLKKIKQFI